MAEICCSHRLDPVSVSGWEPKPRFRLLQARVKISTFFVHFICKYVSIDQVQKWNRGERAYISGMRERLKEGFMVEVTLGIKLGFKV